MCVCVCVGGQSRWYEGRSLVESRYVAEGMVEFQTCWMCKQLVFRNVSSIANFLSVKTGTRQFLAHRYAEAQELTSVT